MATELKCPNCGTPAVGFEDGKVVCVHCGGTFTFVEGEARLAGVGEYDQLKETVESHAADIDELKQRLPASVPADAPDEDEEPDGEGDDQDDL